MTRDPVNFREYAGTLTAVVIVIAFIGIGFVQVGVVVWRGTPVTVPGDWMAAMLSLASAALGYLIGKQSTGAPINTTTTLTQVEVEPTPAKKEVKL